MEVFYIDKGTISKKDKLKYYTLQFSRQIKYLGVLAAILTLAFDHRAFAWLSLLALFVIVEMALDFSLLKAALFQYTAKLLNRFKPSPKAISNDMIKTKTKFSLPFEGQWVVINGSYEKAQSHSWGISPQRYAYDFIQLDENPKSFKNDWSQMSDYYCYDEKILAPADGEVVKVYNKAQDSILFKPGKFLSKSNHIAGNHIILKHKAKEYTTLAHLKKDSITVKKGDKVKRGQVIARCGNTGNSTEPHLHFQLQDHKSFFFSNGLPIEFQNIKLETINNYEAIDPRPKMAKKDLLEGYITRGYKVFNQES